MGLVELLLLSIGLAMDAFAVSICKGLAMKRITIKECLICGIWFGSFQGLMPLLGYILGVSFANMINKVAPWVAFILLALIGGNMLKESFSKDDEEAKPGLDVKTMFVMAIATSIDAFAVGITFIAVPVTVLNAHQFINTLFGCGVIAITTFIISAFGVKIGAIFGTKFKSAAEAAGGIVLILIGLKIILEHLGIIAF